ncbi:uncharacterized protein LOC143522869 isoform X1 [Brachyhypopomus gauderio]|uniref:uncharacterized protein LOC143522869 isoform X1 n=2 Tax=Brachyhypopomus gauderio TaxID=698409 RepID=UPI00404133FD
MSVRSDQSMDLPDQSVDLPIMFKNRVTSDRLTSPAPSCTSMKSDQSMDPPLTFNRETAVMSVTQDRLSSPAPSCTSMETDHSMDPPLTFNKETAVMSVTQDRLSSPAPSYTSMKTDHSMDPPLTFNKETAVMSLKQDGPTPAPSCLSGNSDRSIDRPVTFSREREGSWIKRETSPSPCQSLKTEAFMAAPNTHRDETFSPDINELSASLLTEDHFRCSVCTDVLKEPVSIPCGHSYCKTCIQTYWKKPTQAGSYSCPQCRKRFNTRPALNTNLALAKVVEKLQQAGFSPALPAQCYAGPGDVVCDFCTGRKLRAVKSCLTCTASYCETHVRQHYTVAALQRHRLVEVTGDLEKTLCKLHHRVLEVFCRTDQTFICFMCMMEEHKEHDTVVSKNEPPTVEINTSVKEHQMIPFNLLEENKMETEMKHLLKEIEEMRTTVENLQRADTELTYLSKLLYRGIEQGLVEVSALGRRLDLGMLYDCHTDSISSDVFLWDEDTLSSMRVSVSRPHTDVRMLEGDSLQERLRALDLTPPLRASVVAGLVEVSGAAAFLNHPTQSQLQDRVTLHYRTSTRLDMLSHTLLQSAAPLSPTNQNTATHVVVAVLYGAQAFFVFDDKSKSRKRSPALNDVVKRNFISHSAAELLSDHDGIQQEKCYFDCAVYTDPGDIKIHVSFDTAIKQYSSLQNLLGSQGENIVPLKVWLYPLKNLDQTSACVAGELSEDILVKAEKVLETLKCHLGICQDMISIYSSLGVITRFPAVKESLSEISSLLQKYQSAFQRAMASCIKTTRERREEEGRGLRDLLKWNSQSPFSTENIQQWLLNKRAEMTALKECIDKKISVKSQKELMSILQDSQDTVLCFTFTSLQGEDPFLLALKRHIGLVNTVNTQQTHLPFRLPDTSQKILSDLHSFMCTKETHEDPDHTKFISVVVPEPQFPGSSLYLYQCGNIVSYNVNLEMRPELPEILHIKQTNVTVRLQRSESQVPNQYRVEFRAVSCRNVVDMKWKIMCYTGENCVIMDLTPDTRYQLRYAVMDYNSMSNYSRITEYQTLPRSRPGQPTVMRQTQKSLTVSWRKAGGDSPVLHHMVEYMEAGLEDWQSILTEGPECECTITSPYSTCYRVRVSAVYVEEDTSRPSEEAEIPVHNWCINLSERKTSLFLEVLKLHTVKKPVELRGWSDEESEVRSFLQCLPYISQLRFNYDVLDDEEQRRSAVEFLLKLIVTAAECDTATRESFTKLLTSVCSYTNFPVVEDYDGIIDQSDFLLDLYSHVKNYETQTGRSVLTALQPVYQSAPAVWKINLSKRKTSLFLEVLKLHTVKKPVKLRGWSDEESEVRSFLQCLPYISQLSGADPYIPSLCKELQSRDQAGQVSPLLQALDFTLSLGGQLSTPSCRAVGRVLGLSVSTLNLTLNPRAISLRGVRLLFTHLTHLRTLSVSGAVVVKMVRTLRTVRSPAPVTVEELSLIHTSTQQPEGALSRVLSSLASLLRLWRVQCLNLTDYKLEAQSLTVLLCHQGPLTIRLCEETLQQLTVVVYEAQEEELTHCFLQKVGGDLTSCTLTWEVIHYFLQYQSITVNFRKSDIRQQNPRELLPVLDRLQIRRLSPSCVLSIITEIYQTGSAHCVSSLLSSTENCITLNCRELDSVHCAALCFTLQHCTAVSLSLLFTSIPEGELESIVPLLKHVSHLSVDRLLLLRLLHCCSVSELQQGAAVVLLSALQHRLDFSCSSALDLREDSHTHTLTLSTEDCRVVSVAVQRAHTHTQLTLHDCEIEEAGVEQLFPIIHTVTLQCSKAVLLRFLSLVRVGSELECVRRAVSLSRALGGEVDLSHTRLDQQACGSLALVLEHSEGLSRLDLSHCQLTDHCLQLLCPQLHKAHVLDLSHNDITDVSAKRIYDTVSTNTNIHTVRLFNNRITDIRLFLSDKRFEIW